MSSWFQDALDTVTGAAGDIGKAAVAGVTDIAKTNIANTVKNKSNTSVDPSAVAPVTTGVTQTGAAYNPATATAAAGAAGVPSWALWLGGLSLVAATIGVVAVVRS
jgi:hypothetical protein